MDREVRESSSIPEIETDPKRKRTSMRKVPEEDNLVNIKSRKSRTLANPEDTLVKVEFLSGDLGQRVEVEGYGPAPRVAEVFPTDDMDDIIEAADIEQIELNIETEAQQAILNFDLTSEYQRPRLDRALEYRKRHMPVRADGSEFPVCSTKTGRFVFKRCGRVDCFREGRKSDFLIFVFELKK